MENGRGEAGSGGIFLVTDSIYRKPKKTKSAYNDGRRKNSAKKWKRKNSSHEKNTVTVKSAKTDSV